MARFYQHLEPGETLGKVTRLKYIDDVSDDEMLLFVFEDGYKCNGELIAPPDTEEDLLQTKKFMVELTGPNNIWIIEEHEVVPDEDRIIVGADGVRYQAPDPTVKTDGGPGANSMTVTAEAKHGRRIEIKRPRKPLKYNREPDEIYLLSLHPELEHGGKPVMPKTNTSAGVHTQVIDKTSTTEDFDFDEPVAASGNTQQTFGANAVNIRPNNVCIDVDKLAGKLEFVINGRKVLLDANELKARLSVSSDQYKKALKGSGQTNLAAIMENEDILIKNMIDKSKKNKCKISMSLTLDIPPQEVYDTIKTVYEDGMAEQFVNSLTARYLSQDNMLSSISTGLSAYYDKNSKCKKPAEGKSE